jgi:carbamate kinase
MQILVALGGNALLKRGEPLTMEAQWQNTQVAARALEGIARNHQLVLTHGNGPQIGLLAMQSVEFKDVEPYPLHVMGAATAGMIGYMIEQELGNLLGYDVPIATILTRVEVDLDDPEFSNPSKFVEPGFTKQQTHALAQKNNWVFKQDGDSWRRVVPSPQPKNILWHRPIRWLLQNGSVVICSGGGGVPIHYLPGTKIAVGVEAVIDKDHASGLLASELPAELFVIATDVEGVYIEYGTPQQRLLTRTTPSELENIEFSKGSMSPKVEAACLFVRRTGNPAVIGALEDIDKIVKSEAGTLIEPDPK